MWNRSSVRWKFVEVLKGPVEAVVKAIADRDVCILWQQHSSL